MRPRYRPQRAHAVVRTADRRRHDIAGSDPACGYHQTWSANLRKFCEIGLSVLSVSVVTGDMTPHKIVLTTQAIGGRILAVARRPQPVGDIL